MITAPLEYYRPSLLARLNRLSRIRNVDFHPVNKHVSCIYLLLSTYLITLRR